MSALAGLALVTRAQIVSAHGGIFEHSYYPPLAPPAPSADLRAYRDARLAAFDYRMTGTLLTGRYIGDIDNALRTELWRSRGGILYASLLIAMDDLKERPDPVAQHMAVELERLYAGAISFRALRVQTTFDCLLEAWFRVPLFV